jgi:3-dehydroquinate dehydratase-1
MKYKTCVSVAETTPNKVKQVLKTALKKSDFVEVRFDFLKIKQIPQTLELIRKDLNRIVCTLRPKTEGGKFSGNEKERMSIIKLIAEYDPFLLDVEFNRITCFMA